MNEYKKIKYDDSVRRCYTAYPIYIVLQSVLNRNISVIFDLFLDLLLLFLLHSIILFLFVLVCFLSLFMFVFLLMSANINREC